MILSIVPAECLLPVSAPLSSNTAAALTGQARMCKNHRNYHFYKLNSRRFARVDFYILATVGVAAPADLLSSYFSIIFPVPFQFHVDLYLYNVCLLIILCSQTMWSPNILQEQSFTKIFCPPKSIFVF